MAARKRLEEKNRDDKKDRKIGGDREGISLQCFTLCCLLPWPFPSFFQKKKSLVLFLYCFPIKRRRGRASEFNRLSKSKTCKGLNRTQASFIVGLKSGLGLSNFRTSDQFLVLCWYVLIFDKGRYWDTCKVKISPLYLPALSICTFIVSKLGPAHRSWVPSKCRCVWWVGAIREDFLEKVRLGPHLWKLPSAGKRED